MPTNDDRREVARRLRRLADRNDGVVWSLVEKHLGLVSDDHFLGSSVYTSPSVLHVADLIEPEPERTCSLDYLDEPYNYIQCSSCGFYDCNPCSNSCLYGNHKKWNYCPNCGAKVVEDAG